MMERSLSLVLYALVLTVSNVLGYAHIPHFVLRRGAVRTSSRSAVAAPLMQEMSASTVSAPLTPKKRVRTFSSESSQLRWDRTTGLISLHRNGAPALQAWLYVPPESDMDFDQMVRPSDVEDNSFDLELPVGSTIRFSLSSAGYWYGGPSTSRALWPINQNRLLRQSLKSNDMLANREAIGSRLDPSWITSTGASVRVTSDGPLDLAMNVPCPSTRDKFKERVSKDDSSMDDSCGCDDDDDRIEGGISAHGALSLSSPYDSCHCSDTSIRLSTNSNVRSAHRRILKSLAQQGPRTMPDLGMMRAPIWSTWARFKMGVNQSQVEQYAEEIVEHGYPRSHMEIDDGWSPAYGDFVFDSSKFPDPRAMVDSLHEKGFRVTVWLIPFADPHSEAYKEGVEKGVWMLGHDGEPEIVKWWQGEGAILNVSDDAACDWFEERLRKMMEETGVDGFKFDAGEAQFVPGSASCSANEFAAKWARLAERLGPAGEVRSAYRTQQIGLWLREFDKDSTWSLHNGLRSLITSSLNAGVSGYAFVLPDMVGGNAYADPTIDDELGEEEGEEGTRSKKEDDGIGSGNDWGGSDGGDSFWYGTLPDEELFIRWLYANALLPAVQFSIPPWSYGDETNKICKKAIDLREQRLPQLQALAVQSVKTGQPIISPMWNFDSHDPTCQIIYDQFMLGYTTIVAPVLEPGVVSRPIYLPEGRWRSERGKIYTGPRWLRDYKVPIDHLPVFDLVKSS
mmetsp:Transcript_24461/g.53389  ORF Transcript_24461/g.53389 Transcript_24461/m.53389 type:complete len:735 (+) Transcript_24461:386-2590(+)